MWEKRKSGASRVRTGDPLLAKQMRYQLRYSPVHYSEQTNQICKVGPGGLEPPTSSLSGMRSNHLSYGPAVFVTQVDILHPIINTSNGVSNIGVSHFLPRKARHNGVSAICSTAISNRLTPPGQRKAQNNECRRNPAPGDQPLLHPMQRTPETTSPKVNGNRR